MRDYLPAIEDQFEALREKYSWAKKRYDLAEPLSEEWHEAGALCKRLEVEWHGLQVLGLIYSGQLTTRGKK